MGLAGTVEIGTLMMGEGGLGLVWPIGDRDPDGGGGE